jgi:hypothetical protein
MTLEQFLLSRNVPVAGPDHSHFKNGWTHVNCPFCGDTGMHLGFADNRITGYCFKCGKHTLSDVFRKLFGSAKDLSQVKFSNSRPVVVVQKHEVLPEIDWPVGASICPERQHVQFLKAKQPEHSILKLHRMFKLKYTSRFGHPANSIIIPVFDANNRMVGWQARDVTGKRTVRYLSSPGFEKTQMLYGINQVTGRSVIVVEGPTDVWKFAPHAVALFGMKHSDWQLDMLANRFDQIYVMFDFETKAQRHAQELVDALRCLGTQSERIAVQSNDPNVNDPGSLSSSETKRIVGQLFNV